MLSSASQNSLVGAFLRKNFAWKIAPRTQTDGEFILSLPILVSPQRQSLNPHVADLPDEQAVFSAAIHGVHRAELFEQFSGAAELTQNRAIEFHLVDLTCNIDVFRWV